MIVYPTDRLYQELAYIAYHFHWAYDQLMTMDHQERQRWVYEITAINNHLDNREDEIWTTLGSQ